jgi:hypothetical protein
LPAIGTRPSGIATYGVLPNLAAVVPAPSYPHSDDHRFGMQGGDYIDNGDGLKPLWEDLGIAWAYDNRSWAVLEPNSSGQYDPSTYMGSPSAADYASDALTRYITVDGIPTWAISNGSGPPDSYPPSSFQAYQDFMAEVGQEQAGVRTSLFPAQAHNYYQVTWEPDMGTGNQWLGTDADFVSLYQAAYQGLHSSDTSAVVMGVTSVSVAGTVAWLQRLAPLGLASNLDGVSTHAYYNGGTFQDAPEDNGYPGDLRSLRHEVATLLPAHARLFSTEVGINYPSGYAPNYPSPAQLMQHGFVVARTHLMLLGEGFDVTHVFYSEDDALPGFGINFNIYSNLIDGSPEISPKPAAMMVAAMTSLLDGTVTLGPLNGLPTGVYGYAFQRLVDGPIVTVLWTHNPTFNATGTFVLSVDEPGTVGSVAGVDAMGNARTQAYANGQLTVPLSEIPTYVISSNAAVAKAGVTTPEGYDPVP